MTTTGDETWKRIGAYLTQRRVKLGYRKRAPWARAVGRPGFRARVITDLELGERGNYSDDTLETAEEVYQLQPGSIRQAVEAGGDPRPLEEEEDGDDDRFPIEHTTYQGQALEIIDDLQADTDDLPDEVADQIIRLSVEHMRAQARLMAEAERRRWEREQGRDG